MTLSETFPGGSGHDTLAGRFFKGGVRTPREISRCSCTDCFPKRHDSLHGRVAVANKHLFALTHELDMGAELRFQVADIDGFHETIMADLTNLVRFILLSLQSREPAFPRFSIALRWMQVP